MGAVSALDPWVLDVAAALGVPATDVPADLRAGLLDLTREIEELIGPSAGPMTGLLLGVAVGRGIAPAGAVDTIRSVLESHRDRHAPTESETIEPAPGADTTVPLARDTAATEDRRH